MELTVPIWFCAARFLDKDDHCNIAECSHSEPLLLALSADHFNASTTVNVNSEVKSLDINTVGGDP
jgi:hypothetical protein